MFKIEGEFKAKSDGWIDRHTGGRTDSWRTTNAQTSLRIRKVIAHLLESIIFKLAAGEFFNCLASLFSGGD